MTTLTVTINEKTAKGKNLIAKLKSSPEVSVTLVKSSWIKRKRKATEAGEDRRLGQLMRREETGKLVSKDSIIKALGSVR